MQGVVPAYCRPDGADFANRLFKETELIAFSDPNDLLSYPIPDAFVQSHVDSRLCPKQVNVTINIAQVTSVLGLGERRAMLVAMLVSSRKMKRAGSMKRCQLRQRRRLAATSGRSCSAALSDFFYASGRAGGACCGSSRARRRRRDGAAAPPGPRRA